MRKTLGLQGAAGMLLAALVLSAALAPQGSRAARARKDDEEAVREVLAAAGAGTARERLARLTAGGAGWPTEAQAEEEFKVLRESREFAPLRGLPHAEGGDDVKRVRRVLAPAFALAGGGATLIVSVVRTERQLFAVTRGAVLLTSTGTLAVLSDDELLAQGLHELGHQFFRAAFIRATDAGDTAKLRRIELLCDAISALGMIELGRKPETLITGLRWLIDPAKGVADNGDGETHPELAARRRLVEALAGQNDRQGG